MTPLAYKQYISTSHSNLVLNHPVTCTFHSIDVNWLVYYINNIMFGQEIIIDACVRDYYDQPADGSNNLLLSCNNLRGIRVIGNEVITTSNISMTLTSHDGNQYDLKTISIEIITELSPCHPGFHYDHTTERCYAMMIMIS